ncbi:hypothetical protein ACP4OV_025483 [Aristida adscensionis]
MLNDDSSLLVTGGAAAATTGWPCSRSSASWTSTPRSSPPSDLAVYRIAAHIGPVTCVACAQGGRSAAVVSASGDGTCKIWSLADGGLRRALVLPCIALSLALDPTGSTLYAAGSDGRVYHASLSSPATSAVMTTAAAAAPLVAVAVANGDKSLVSCGEDGEVKVWDLTRGGLLLANTFSLGAAVKDVLVAERSAGEPAGGGGGGEGLGACVGGRSKGRARRKRWSRCCGSRWWAGTGPWS